MSDDDVLRLLREQAVHAVPPSRLDPAVVLAGARRSRTRVLVARSLGGLAAMGLVAAGAVALAHPDDGSLAPAVPSGTATPDRPTATSPGTFGMCAELPSGIATGPYEGWWSSTPADADGEVLTDPADWPAQMREHPRLAVVDTRTGVVLGTIDRVACAGLPDYVVPGGADLPADAVVVIDAVTGEVLERLRGSGGLG